MMGNSVGEDGGKMGQVMVQRPNYFKIMLCFTIINVWNKQSLA